MIQLRSYQIDLSLNTAELLRTKGIAYLTFEVRTGKTLTSLNAAKVFGAKKVLFLTRKRAIQSIIDDYNLLQPDFEIRIINNESLHTIKENDFDLLISDEHHRNSAFPRINLTTKEIKKRFGHLPMIFLSGTPAIESGSQWYHSFWISNNSPFREYKNFYSWAKDFTRPKTKYIGSLRVAVYTDSIDEKIMPFVDPYLLKFTQEDAGFTSTISENILYCQMTNQTNNMIKILLKDRLFTGTNDCILGDSAAKLMSKIHQIANGTVILESGNSVILDTSKAEFIITKFAGKKMALFYNFAMELELLKSVIPNITTDLNEFNTTDKHIALQQVAGSEGISLKKADVLIYYNFGYSGKNFVQSRDRMTTIDRVENNVYFIYQKGDVNSKIHNVLKAKKRYSETIFKKDFEC
jgi:hypothetical protein